MAINYEILRTEIQTDPLTRGYASMNANEIADSLNTVDRPVRKPADIWRLKKHAIENGYWINLKFASTGNPGYYNSVLYMDYMSDMRFDTIDLDNQTIRDFFISLIANGFMTEAQALELDAFGNSLQSRATELGLDGVSSGHVLMIIQ